jgi:hypothetical protein
MGTGIFLEKEHRPSQGEIARTVGGKWELFRALAAFLRQNYQLDGELNYGGRNYGWNFWYRKSGKTLVNLFPQKGFLVAQVVLGKEQVEKGSMLALGKNVKDVFSRAPQFHDGRWLYIPVKSKRDVRDVQALILLKRKPSGK